MNILLKRLLVLVLLMLGSISLSFGASCCYIDDTSGEDDIREYSSQERCEARGGIHLGDGDTSQENQCESFINERASCELGGGRGCTNYINGMAIYDNQDVLGSIDSSMCSDIVEFDDTCSATINSESESGFGEGDTGSTGGGPSGEGEGSTGEDVPDEEASVGDTIGGEIDNICKAQGGSFLGFFANKQACEQIEASGNQLCIYNPHKGGILSTELHYNYEDSSIAPFEQPSCISKAKVQKCSDYKTKNNCVNNKAYGENSFESRSSALADGCSWVPSQEYASTLNNQTQGMCVSKAVEEDVDYNIEEYGMRKNIVKNALFRNSDQYWETQGSIVSDSFDGDGRAIKLEEEQTLTQQISNLGKQTSYTPFFEIKQLTQGDVPDVTLTGINREGEIVETYTPTSTNSVLINDTFRRVNYESFTISENIHSLNFTIKANAQTIIDAVALQSPDVDNRVENGRLFFPTELVPEEASYCGECFDALGLNTCTKEKSDSLGACSYMVSGPQQKYMYNESSQNAYTGKNNNVYMRVDEENPVKGKWSSQSIASSQVFCEMYVTQESCTDSNSYVNKKYAPLHLFSKENQLCKWDENVGCFKDSNNDNKPDVKAGFIRSQNNTESQENVFTLPVLNSYKQESFERNGKQIPSDFASACDTLPPIVHSFVEAKNTSGDVIKVENNNYDGLIGNVSLRIKVQDVLPYDYACEPYTSQQSAAEISKDTFIVFSSEDSSPKMQIGGMGLQRYNLKDVFGTIDDVGNLSYKVFDQSGNVGAKKDFEGLNVDLNSPALKPEFEAKIHEKGDTFYDEPKEITQGISEFAFIKSSKYLAQESTLNFSLTDKGGVDSCRYSFENVDGLNENSNLEGKTIPEITFEEKRNEESFGINLSQHINNVKTTGGGADIVVNCEDIFGQTTTHRYTFRVVGDLYVHTPKPIEFNPEDYTSDNIFFSEEGFYNTSTHNVEVFISRNDIESCSFAGKSMPIATEGSFEVEGIDGSFEAKASSTNLEFSNSQSSQKDIQIQCETRSGTQVSGEVTYFIENDLPQLNSMKLSEEENHTYYDQNQDIWYSIKEPSNTKIVLEMDGTNSWINRKYDLYLGEELIESSVYNSINYNLYDNGHNFVSDNITINGVNDISPQTINNDVVKLIQDNVQQYDFDIAIEDKAGNMQNQSFSYRYDGTTPALNFGGDIINQNNGQNPRLYTSKEDPQINLSFNTPQYRTYNCDISINYPRGEIIQDLKTVPQSNYVFKLSNFLNADVDVSEDDISFSLNCEGVMFSEEVLYSGDEYSFVYDNTAPVLNNVSFSQGNKRYFGNAKGLVIDEVVDDLVYEFNDTNEERYTCEYRFETAENYYNCNEDMESRNFYDGSTSQSISNINILTGFRDDRYSSDSSFRCYQRTGNFWNKYDEKRQNNESFETKIKVTTQCRDGVGLKTQRKSTTLDVIYATGQIGDVNFNFEDGVAKPIITMLSSQVEGLNYVFKYKGERIFNQQPSSVEETSQNYEVTFGDSGIDTSQFFEGEHELTLEVYGGESTPIYEKKVMLNIDTQAPTASLRILDNIEGEIDSENFKIDFSAKDEGSSSIDSLKLNVINQGTKTLLYSKEFGVENQNSFSDQKPYIRKETKDEFDGSYFFQGNKEENYEFELVVKDGAGNTNRTNITTQIANDVEFALEDSQSAKVSVDPYTLLTRSNKQININGQIYPEATCELYPYIQNDMEDIDEKEESIPAGKNNDFSMNLGDLIGFSMEKAKTNTIILHFECSENGNNYEFRRELTKIEGLPDYTLQSSNGFYFNGVESNDYDTQLKITSVGPFKQIQCEYTINGNTQTTSFGRQFITEKNFQGSSTQQIELTCEDPFEVSGPTKQYDLVVTDDSPKIGNVTLSSNNYEKTLSNEGEFDVARDIEYDLEFEVNKKGIECSYNIVSGGSFPGEVAGFFESMFNIGAVSIQESQTPYIYRATQGFNSDGKLEVTCGSASKTFELNLIEDEEAQLNLS